ncbi:copper resistance protein NlpE N-terminal domain-containing protein [Vaginella massiliensis]|uniref:copper resistance protein NlpE N-terminal domain-containing protein n=1 Tax=Vaginella massiliensis TaxID=1816680 RepID=UPI0008394C58|nr:copper resistance protein NlpE N-terminal domain-containing protein [Vaginella massiliensis]
MKKNTLALIVLLGINFWSCGKQESSIQEVDLPTPADSIQIDSATTEAVVVEQQEDFHGKFDHQDPLTYSITLNPDNTYVYKTIDDKTKEELFTTGIYTIQDDGRTLMLDNVAVGPNTFRIEGNQLIELDEKFQPKKSDGKVNYILIKK